MTISSATAADLTPMLEEFRQVAWPLSREDVLAIGERLGWRLRGNQPSGLTYRSGLPFRIDRAHCLLRDDQVGEVKVELTDVIDREDGAAAQELERVQQALVASAASVLGEPSGVTSWSPTTFWDLASGGRIAVKRLADRVLLVVLSREHADIERAEARYGVDPDRVVGVDPEPA